MFTWYYVSEKFFLWRCVFTHKAVAAVFASFNHGQNYNHWEYEMLGEPFDVSDPYVEVLGVEQQQLQEAA